MCVDGVVHSSASEAPPSDDLNLVLHVTGLPLTATEESIVAMLSLIHI